MPSETSQPSSLRSVLQGQAKDALVFTGTTFLTKLGSFLLLPLYWRKLSPDDYGVVAVVAIIGSFQALVSSMSLDLSVTRFFYQWPEQDRRRNLGAIWVWSWINNLIWCGLFLLVMPHISRFLFPDISYRPYLMLGIIGNAAAGLFLIPGTSIRIKRLPWLFASQNFASFALSTGFGLWLVLVRDQKLLGYLTSVIWSNLLMAGFGAVVMLSFSRPALWSPGFRDALRLSLPAVPSNFINVAGSIVDRFLLNYYSNLHTLGLYAVSTRFVDIIGQLHASLKMTYGPFMMKEISEDPLNGRATVASVTPYYMVPYFIAGLALAFFIGPFVQFIDQPAYFEVIDWVPWITGVTLLNCSSFYYANGMVLGRRTDLLTVPSLVQLAVLVPASMLLIRPYQLAGLIAGRYLSGGAFVVLSIYLSQKAFALPHRWGKLLALSVAWIVFAVAGRLLPVHDPLWEIAAKILLLTGFSGAAFWLMWGREHSGLRAALGWTRTK